MNESAPTKRRKVDPQRRLRIVEAALEVIAESSVEGLTHRAVAERAGVPLGATTYYFVDKEELLASAAELASERNLVELRTLLADLLTRFDLAAALAEFIEELTCNRREQLILDYNIYLAAIRRPELREPSRSWAIACDELVSDRTDDAAGRALGFVVDGVLVRAALLDIGIGRAEIEPVLRRILAA